MQLRTIIFYGRSGSGKTTQLDLLRDLFAQKDQERSLFYIQTGNEFRTFVEEDSYTSTLAREIMETGGLQPEFLPIWIWTGLLIKNMTGNEHFFCDGLVRRYAEALVFDGALQFYKRERPDVVHINVSQEWATDRLSERGRHDDTAAGISKRLDWFDTETKPAIEYFRSHAYYNFIDINGEQSIENVAKDIATALKL
ncbi:MAG: adenylate kinase [Parcubacteria group bacterium Gr01-1014_48]|nr:MAG: adenylate kinase [Parcubacteria group bacterium Greene0416_14]TSC71787.1 MAG: adenylate kinase [Parcubacteria group bacterium Gr01-1014_48]TSD00574.1 MAG: adenylate kinase [Parcubacteria group bacterium Greene1014_15]